MSKFLVSHFNAQMSEEVMDGTDDLICNGGNNDDEGGVGPCPVGSHRYQLVEVVVGSCHAQDIRKGLA